MLTNKDYQDRLEKLRENRVLLDSNPIDRGLSYLISKIAEVQAARDVVISTLVEAMQDKTEKGVVLENLETEHKMELQGILANDQEVKGQKSSDLRSSLANVKIAELALKVHHAKIDSYVSDGFLSIVKYFYENLQRLSDSLEQQISLVKLHYEQENHVPQNTVSQNKEK